MSVCVFSPQEGRGGGVLAAGVRQVHALGSEDLGAHLSLLLDIIVAGRDSRVGLEGGQKQ